MRSRAAGLRIAPVLMLCALPFCTLLPAPSQAQLTRAEKEELLRAHNAWRARHQVDALRWSEDLARYAQSWAEHLAEKGGPLVHSAQNGKARPDAEALGYRDWGENLYWSSAIVWSDGTREVNHRLTPAQVVESWGEEERWYHFTTGACSAPPNQACGHFTQVVWKGSLQVGCGKAVGSDRSQIWACSYDPPGNYQGEYTRNVLPPGNVP